MSDLVYRYSKADSTHPRAKKSSKPILYTINNRNCWEVFSHHKDKDGYTRVLRRIDGKKKMFYLHRVVFEIEKGIIPEGMVIMHSCDNPSCVNPDHLSIGSNLENLRDKVSKNRQARGKTNGNAKLTESDVYAIREDTRFYREIGKAYGITKQQVYEIKSRRSWAHLEEENK